MVRGYDAQEVIQRMKTQFVRHGISESLITDNGPLFNSYEFKKIIKE